MRKTFEITEDDVLRHLSKQPNQTYYIIELIKNDMYKKKEDITKDTVIKIIKEYLEGNTCISAKKNDTSVSETVINSAMNIISMVKKQ